MSYFRDRAFAEVPAPPVPKPPGCAYDVGQAVQIEMPAARAALERSRQVAERFIGSYGALSATGRFTKTVLDDKYCLPNYTNILPIRNRNGPNHSVSTARF